MRGASSVANISTRLETQTKATGSPNCSATASSNKSTPVKKAALVSYQDFSDKKDSPGLMDLECDAEMDGDGKEGDDEAEQRIHNMVEFWQKGVVKPIYEPPGHCTKGAPGED